MSRYAQPRATGSGLDALTNVDAERLSGRMEPIRFTGTIRYWDVTKGSGLAVVDIPSEHIQVLGGLKQQRARGSLAGAEYASSVMSLG